MARILGILPAVIMWILLVYGILINLSSGRIWETWTIFLLVGLALGALLVTIVTISGRKEEQR